MKRIIRNILLLCLIVGVRDACAESFRLTSKDVAEVREKLEKYVEGKLTLEEATDGEEWGKKVIAYHLAGTNEVSVKMKLPIARCYAIFSSYTNAARLASEYVNVYTNDVRGWDLLAGAKIAQRSFDEAVAAGTNAIRLGSQRNLALLGGAALAIDRMDVLESMIVPRLLVLKDVAGTPDEEKGPMINTLVVYSLNANKKEVFVKAIEGVDAALILSDHRLKRNVELGCEYFETKESEKLYNQIKRSKAVKSTNGKQPERTD